MSSPRNETDTRITDLSRDALLHLSGFFSPHQLQVNKLVSKRFKYISEKALQQLHNKTKNQLYYAVGKPILISAPRNIFEKSICRFFGADYDVLWINFRKFVSGEEIIEAFPFNESAVKLFLNEKDALLYSRSLRKVQDNLNYTRDEIVHQPAIYVVQSLGDVDDLIFKTDDVAIEQHNENDHFRQNKLECKLKYFDTESEYIVPISGQLKIELDVEGQYQAYPQFKFKHCEYKNNEISATLSRWFT